MEEEGHIIWISGKETKTGVVLTRMDIKALEKREAVFC
jgi:hypothetical protein